VVRHEEDGLLVPCGDVAGLAAALARLLDNPGLRHRLGRAGNARARQEMTWPGRLQLVRSKYVKFVSQARPNVHSSQSGPRG
jgi:glycosyltransferase involved in cell wall biosynthesis